MDGFVDGVSALNRTAIHVLHEGDGSKFSNGHHKFTTHRNDADDESTMATKTQNE